MPEEAEMEVLINDLTEGFGRGIIIEERGDIDGSSKQTKIMGIMAVDCGTDRVSGKNFLQD